jgi:hypothetical protein
MSFEQIEKYLDKIEAVSNYDSVLNRNIELGKVIEDQKQLIRSLKKQVKDLQEIKIKYNENSYNLEEFQRLVEKSAEKWKKHVLTKELEKKWQTEKDSLVINSVQEDLKQYPYCSEPLKGIIDEKSKSEVDRILKSEMSWPDWFKSQLASKIQKRTNEQMDQNYYNSIEQGVLNRLMELKAIEWQEYVRTHTAPFFQQSFRDQYLTLSQEVYYTCDTCGTECMIDLDPDNMRKIVNRGTLRIHCCNENCKGPIGRKMTTIRFDEIIRQKLLPEPTIGPKYKPLQPKYKPVSNPNDPGKKTDEQDKEPT